ncbi:hypothetical protein TEK04_14320 [Klenkia sp. LSe6-5]|uniref:Uncharacterized protein n=1 Tax=Klenkia sesuvii TaxID=3103137 RepID=A0ABU8DVM4_9ACTN
MTARPPADDAAGTTAFHEPPDRGRDLATVPARATTSPALPDAFPGWASTN